MKSTIYDIARVANVSKSTVSRVLNNQENISEEAKNRVLAAIKELNYKPSKVARALSNVGFDAIMVVLSRSAKTTIGNPFFSEILHTISTKAEEEDFDLILQTAKNSNEELEKCSIKIKEKMIKGIIMLSSPMDDEFFLQLDQFDTPIVVIGNVDPVYNNISSIDTDNYQNSYDLTQVLIDQGHRDIACIYPPANYHVTIDRVAGFYCCMKDNGLTVVDYWMINGGVSAESAYDAADRLLSSENKPSAVVAMDDAKVLAIYQVAAEKGISIPEQISIVGYSHELISNFLSPALTTVRVPTKELGEAGVDLLLKKIRKEVLEPKKLIIATELVKGNSVNSKL